MLGLSCSTRSWRWNQWLSGHPIYGRVSSILCCLQSRRLRSLSDWKLIIDISMLWISSIDCVASLFRWYYYFLPEKYHSTIWIRFWAEVKSTYVCQTATTASDISPFQSVTLTSVIPIFRFPPSQAQLTLNPVWKTHGPLGKPVPLQKGLRQLYGKRSLVHLYLIDSLI